MPWFSLPLKLIGHRTCQAMTNITDILSGPSVFSNETRVCALSIDCQEISCTTSEGGRYGYQVFELILLPCVTPPAVRIVFSGSINYDHTFYQDEEDNIRIGRIGVKLDHLLNDTIGLQVNLLFYVFRNNLSKRLKNTT